MNKLILISGDLAAGKSTFSRILSKKFNIMVINKDTIKEILGDTIGFTNREENLKLSNATMRIMIHMFCESAMLGKDLILEANFHKSELEEIFENAKKYNYDIKELYLKADIDILHKRFINRIENENRHKVHLSGNFDNYDIFKEYIEKSREDNYGDITYIDANDFSYQEDEKLFNEINDFLNK